MHLHNICEAATTDEDDDEEDTAKKDVFNNSSNLEKYKIISEYNYYWWNIPTPCRFRST